MNMYITRYQISCLDFVYSIKTLIPEHRHTQSRSEEERVTVGDYVR